MVISLNNEPNGREFENLLNSTMSTLEFEAQKNQNKFLGLLGNKLENEVFDILCYNAKGTVFDGSIELISGQRFPDIIAKKYYGVEVKTTKSNHWKSTGSSVMEGTRVDGIERIFMLFGKMYNPVQFKCRPYEECLSEVVVTHSPRYLIDMNLQQGATIFDKIDIPYDVLRKQTNPIKTILNYYKKQMKEGDGVWYLENENTQSTNLIIKMWKNLSITEHNDIRIKGFCLFPELFSKQNNKYSRFAIWLSTVEGIVCTNVRDVFTAGGRFPIQFNGISYSTPQILKQLFENALAVKELLYSIDNDELSEYWGAKISDKNKLTIWKKLVIENSNSIIDNNLPLYDILTDLIK